MYEMPAQESLATAAGPWMLLIIVGAAYQRSGNSLQDGCPTRSTVEGDRSPNTSGAVKSKWQRSKAPAIFAAVSCSSLVLQDTPECTLAAKADSRVP